MFKKTITFVDFNDDERTQDFYFHLSKDEILTAAAGGEAYTAYLNRIIQSKDNLAIMETFKNIIKNACGIRSEDGSRFLKSPEAQSALLDSGAFGELLLELCTDADAAADFITQLFPKKTMDDLAARMQSKSDDKNPTIVETPQDDQPAWIRENRRPTDMELRNMSKDEMVMAMQKLVR